MQYVAAWHCRREGHREGHQVTGKPLKTWQKAQPRGEAAGLNRSRLSLGLQCGVFSVLLPFLWDCVLVGGAWSAFADWFSLLGTGFC